MCHNGALDSGAMGCPILVICLPWVGEGGDKKKSCTRVILSEELNWDSK